jgi:hypothetical protein
MCATKIYAKLLATHLKIPYKLKPNIKLFSNYGIIVCWSSQIYFGVQLCGV